MKSNNKLIKLCIISILIVLLTYVIANTYSKYINGLNNGKRYDISKWHIKVNNIDISNTGNYKNDLSIILNDSSNLAPNTIAPGCTGYFDIEVNYQGTDIPFNMNFKANDVNTDYSSKLDITREDDLGNTFVYGMLVDYRYVATPIFYTTNTGKTYYFDGADYIETPFLYTISIQVPDTISPNPSLSSDVQLDNYDVTTNTITFTPLLSKWETDTTNRIYLDPSDPTKFVDYTTSVYTTSYCTNICEFHDFKLETTDNTLTDDEIFIKTFINNKELMIATDSKFDIIGYSINDDITDNKICLLPESPMIPNGYTTTTYTAVKYNPEDGTVYQIINPSNYCTYYNNGRAPSDQISESYSNDKLNLRIHVLWNDYFDENEIIDENDTKLGHQAATSATPIYLKKNFNLIFNQLAKGDLSI